MSCRLHRWIPGKEEGFPSGRRSSSRISRGVEVFVEKMGMGGRAEVYDAEMAGLKTGASRAMKLSQTTQK